MRLRIVRWRTQVHRVFFARTLPRLVPEIFHVHRVRTRWRKVRLFGRRLMRTAIRARCLRIRARILRRCEGPTKEQNQEPNSHSFILTSSAGRPKCLQASLRRFQFGISASLLLNEVVLSSTGTLGGLEDGLPICFSLAEQRLVANVRIRGPVFTMDGANAPRVGSDPCYRVAASLQARPHI